MRRVGFGTVEMMRPTGAAAGMGGGDAYIRTGTGQVPRIRLESRP